MTRGSSRLVFDGATLATELGADPGCFAGKPVRAYAHVCAEVDPDALLPYDHPEVQQVRRDALAWWIPLPFARILAGTIVETELFSYVPSPPGPVVERYSGAAWSGGAFV